MDRLTLLWLLCLGLPTLALHLVSVTLTKALRAYSRSRLEEVCDDRGHEGRADEVAHLDEKTEMAAETLAVLTGLALAALVGIAVDRQAPSFAVESVLAIALCIAAIGYVMAGVIGRVFAEPVIDSLWTSSRWLRLLTKPFTSSIHQVETLVERLASKPDSMPRPASVEVEIPADYDHSEESETDIPESTRELLKHAVALTRRDVIELMTPRASIISMPSSVTSRAAARTFRETGRSRIPLYGVNRDDIVGILYAKDLFPSMTEAHDPDSVSPKELARPPYGVPESKNAYELLEEFRANRTQIAIVLNEYGGVSGLITLEDLVEDLVGTIDDEHDTPTPENRVVSLGDGRYDVDATVAIEELNEHVDLKLPTDGDFLTLGGYLFHVLGHVPDPGATFRNDRAEFRVVEVVDHTIRRVLIELNPSEVAGNGARAG